MKKKRQKFNIGLLVGLVAIVINVITVSIYWYQAHIMQSQQHAAAWPYLEWLPSYNEEQYYIEVTNNGIGPAIIDATKIMLNGKVIPNVDSLFIELIGTNYFPHLTSTVENRVLPAGKSIKIFQVNSSQWAGTLFKAVQENKFEFEICYRSIYGDSWTCRGTDVIESNCKKGS